VPPKVAGQTYCLQKLERATSTVDVLKTLLKVSKSQRPRIARAPVVAVVGGGQLARMTHQAAIALGQSLRVLAMSPDDPAAR